MTNGYGPDGRPIDACQCGMSFRTGEDYRDHLPCPAINWTETPKPRTKLSKDVRAALDKIQLEFELQVDENAVLTRAVLKSTEQQVRDTKVVRDFAASLGFPMPNSHIGDIITVLSAKLTVARLLEALKDETRIPANKVFSEVPCA